LTPELGQLLRTEVARESVPELTLVVHNVPP